MTRLSNEKFAELEMNILKRAVTVAETERDIGILNSPDTRRIIQIVETFLKNGKMVCYGGTAINNILPKKHQFYDMTREFPDYDFYSLNAMDDAKRLADIYYKEGFIDVEAKAGVHHGTYKVFVNFMPVADITQMVPELFKTIYRDSIAVKGIRYAPPNLLRMGMYLELSRPEGDISRWEKVLKRLSLLNTNFPLKGDQCSGIDFQRKFENTSLNTGDIYHILRGTFISNKCVFFGGFAAAVYSRYMKRPGVRDMFYEPDFDVISTDPHGVANKVVKLLKSRGYAANMKIRDAAGEIIPEHIELRIDNESVAFIYHPMACHNYNVIHVKGQKVRIATIDTILSIYLAFIYTDRSYHDMRRLLCMAEYLFEVQKHNRLSQKGVLKRFSLECYGNQTTLDSFRLEKSKMFDKLKKNRNSREWDEWFLRYLPGGKSGDTGVVAKSPAKSPTRKKSSKSVRNRTVRSIVRKSQKLKRRRIRSKQRTRKIGRSH
jgi:hypothetical protein